MTFLEIQLRRHLLSIYILKSTFLYVSLQELQSAIDRDETMVPAVRISRRRDS